MDHENMTFERKDLKNEIISIDNSNSFNCNIMTD